MLLKTLNVDFGAIVRHLRIWPTFSCTTFQRIIQNYVYGEKSNIISVCDWCCGPFRQYRAGEILRFSDPLIIRTSEGASHGSCDNGINPYCSISAGLQGNVESSGQHVNTKTYVSAETGVAAIEFVSPLNLAVKKACGCQG